MYMRNYDELQREIKKFKLKLLATGLILDPIVNTFFMNTERWIQIKCVIKSNNNIIIRKSIKESHNDFERLYNNVMTRGLIDE